MNTRNITTFAAIAVACLAGSSAYAGTRTAAPSKQVKETVIESCITGDVGVDFVSNYITRGIVLENQGLIVQPYADLHFRLYKGAGPVDSITADIGIWNSFHDHRPGVGGTTSNWFEFDFTAGLSLDIDKFRVSPYFRTYESPADAFSNDYVVGTRLSYDDKGLLGDFALHPYARVELNLIQTSGNNRNAARPFANQANGQYYEVGIAPDSGTHFGDLKLSLPVKAGFGSGGYYLGNRGFGFFSVGIDAEYALNMIPECLGKWTVHSGVTYVRLGGRDDVNAPAGAAGLSPAFSNGPVSDKNQIVFGGGLKVAF
jgi:hypothetical protein